jgi:hypothetical protein
MSEEVKSASEQKKEDWMNSKWRPMMGWMYMVVCTMDMVIFPILWSLLQTLTHTQITQWQPLTLQGAGLFHIAMGAVLGLAAWGRTQEKLGGANNGGLQPMAPSSGSQFGAPAAGGFGSAGQGFGTPSSGFSRAPAGNFGAPAGGGSTFGAVPTAVAGGFGVAAVAASVPFVSNEVVMGPGGKPAPIQPPDPEL